MKLAPCAEWTLRKLAEAGYEAYAVGGCCRDALLGREPQDWDVCTSAEPEKLLEVFPDAIPTGLKHGTVTVRAPGALVEVTTYRVDGEYHDHRRPDEVRFTRSLREDLARRDFTMNAIACPLTGELVDPFEGARDIEARLIRCVGEPERRFTEDALRMFRAVRFSAQLGFELEPGLVAAARALAGTADFVAAERVWAETKKALLSERPERLSLAVELGLYRRFLGADGGVPKLEMLSALPADETIRAAAFCAAVRRAGFSVGAGELMRSLRAPGEVIKACAAALDPEPVWLSCDSMSEIAAAVGRERALGAAAAMEAYGIDGSFSPMEKLLESGNCLAVSELALSGGEIAALGLRGRAVGECQQRLLRHVLAHPENNTREALLKLI